MEKLQKEVQKIFFIIKDDIIQTPPLSAGGLEGITRDAVIQIIEENGGFCH